MAYPLTFIAVHIENMYFVGEIECVNTVDESRPNRFFHFEIRRWSSMVMQWSLPFAWAKVIFWFPIPLQSKQWASTQPSAVQCVPALEIGRSTKSYFYFPPLDKFLSESATLGNERSYRFERIRAQIGSASRTILFRKLQTTWLLYWMKWRTGEICPKQNSPWNAPESRQTFLFIFVRLQIMNNVWHKCIQTLN